MKVEQVIEEINRCNFTHVNSDNLEETCETLSILVDEYLKVKEELDNLKKPRPFLDPDVTDEELEGLPEE